MFYRNRIGAVESVEEGETQCAGPRTLTSGRYLAS